jgi:uncharacterized repeat protein (TIGR01451 family)
MNAMPGLSQRTRSSMLLLRAAVCATLAGATPAVAQQAGTPITNIAVADMDMETAHARVASNRAVLQVDELLDIRLAAATSGLTLGAGQPAASFTLTNAGNGSERFFLAGTVEGSSGTVRGFALDANGNGVFDAGDTLLDGGTTPALAPGQSLALLVLLDADAASTAGTLNVFGRAATGSGSPGTLYTGRGDQGSDAVVGVTTAEATLRFTLATSPMPEATLVKTQSILAANGTATANRGATITYTLAARFAGSGSARAASVSDPIPAGTLYVPGSLTLDGVGLSDASDTDAGNFDGTRIAVALGDIAGPQTRNIQFKVTIQ